MIKYIPEKFVLIRTIYVTVQYFFLLHFTKGAMGPKTMAWAKSTYRVLKHDCLEREQMKI